MSKWRANKKYRPYQIASYHAEKSVQLESGQRENTHLNYLVGAAGNVQHDGRSQTSLHSFHVFWRFEAIGEQEPPSRFEVKIALM